jgi:subtilisin family serine protease
VAEPEYFVHVAGPRICPATEPAETGLAKPWPPVNRDKNAGKGVRVVVVDSGWHAPAGEKQPWLSGVTGEDEPQGVKDAQGRIRPYAGHGTFVAGVIKAIAPACKVHILSLHVNPNVPGGGARESEIVDQLEKALRRRPAPHLINLSAGTSTRSNDGPSAFRHWWLDVRTSHPELVLVAAAGNDSSPADFWPASFGWAVGVGALDRDGSRSGFSNYGPRVDVYALGRNLVNAFPSGTYIGHERPIRGDIRRFTRMMARWSGTSFSTPIVTGLIAAEMSKTRPLTPATQARDAVLQRAAQQRPPWSNRAKVLMPPYS